MTIGIVLALSAAVIYGFLGVCYEFAAKRKYNSWHVGTIMQLTGFIIGLVVTVVTGRLVWDARLLLFGALGGISFVAGLYWYLEASHESDIAANWTICNLSVVLNILFSVVWFKDPFTASKGLGAVLTLASIITIGWGFPKTGAGRPSRRWFILITLSFLSNAIIPGQLRFVPGEQAALFTTYLYGTGFLMFLLADLATQRSWDVAPGLVGAAVGAATTHWSGIMLTMLALIAVARVSRQAGLVVYPITNGLVIPIGVILGALILKEKFSASSKIGVALGMAAMALLSMP
jgi:drug/metabolite transporter (DMT)-like permease